MSVIEVEIVVVHLRRKDVVGGHVRDVRDIGPLNQKTFPVVSF